jgi:peroxiredoxin
MKQRKVTSAMTEPHKTPLAIGDRAPDVELSDHEGHAIRLSSVWQSQPSVLLFVRHFG